MKKPLILTHAGAAHSDEYMAIVLLVWAKKWKEEDFEILRINHGEISDYRQSDRAADTYFIDIGGQFDGVRNFDHHQWDPTLDKKEVPHDLRKWYQCSAATLVGKSLCPEILADPYIGSAVSRIQKIDTLGIVGTAKAKNSPTKAVMGSFMLEAKILLGWFSRDPIGAVMEGVKYIKEKEEFIKVRNFFHSSMTTSVEEMKERNIKVLTLKNLVAPGVKEGLKFSEKSFQNITLENIAKVTGAVRAATNPDVKRTEADMWYATLEGFTILGRTTHGHHRDFSLRLLNIKPEDIVFLNDKNAVLRREVGLCDIMRARVPKQFWNPRGD